MSNPLPYCLECMSAQKFAILKRHEAIKVRMTQVCHAQVGEMWQDGNFELEDSGVQRPGEIKNVLEVFGGTFRKTREGGNYRHLTAVIGTRNFFPGTREARSNFDLRGLEDKV
jgi:hypothetical protein